MRSHYCVLTVLGDLLDGGELHFVEAVQTLEAARQRIEALAELDPGQYIIYNKETGERVSVVAGVQSSSERGRAPQNKPLTCRG